MPPRNPEPTDPPAAAPAVLPAELYERLRTAARRLMRGEGADHTLQTTALVHEAWLRLTHSDPELRQEPQRVLAAASEAMRRALIDHARTRGRLKRGGGAKRELFDLADLPIVADAEPEQVLALDDAFGRLADEDPEAAEVVRLRFHLGLGVEETAAALGLSPRTVKRRWAFARSWLFRELHDGQALPDAAAG